MEDIDFSKFSNMNEEDWQWWQSNPQQGAQQQNTLTPMSSPDEIEDVTPESLWQDESQENPTEEAAETPATEAQEDTTEQSSQWWEEMINEVDSLLNELLNMDLTKEQDSLDKAIASWDIDSIKQENEAMKSTLQERDMKLKEFEKKFEILNKEYEKVLDEKMLWDYENQSKMKMLNVVDDDSWLKAILAYKYKSETDPVYKDKLVDAVKNYLEDIAWVNIDDILQKQKNFEKTWMDTSNDVSFGTAPNNSNRFLDMFE